MGKKLRIFMILLNVIVFLIIDQSSVDYNAVNFFILNIFVLSVLLYLDNKKQSSVQNDFISFQEIIQGLKKLFMKPLNWLLLISPTVFYLENSSPLVFSSIQYFFLIVLLFHLVLNVFVLSMILLRLYFKLYYIHIIITGIIFQVYIFAFSNSYSFLVIFLIGYILTSYVVILYLLKTKGENYASR